MTQVRYDMRGHGRSGKPDSMENYSPQLYANDFLAVSRRPREFAMQVVERVERVVHSVVPRCRAVVP